MRKKQELFILMFTVMIAITSCTGIIKYSAPTITQVNDFIFKNSVNALAIKETTDFTIVLYQNENSYGHYVLYQDQKKQLYNGGVNAGGNSKVSPVSLGGVASGKIPFVTVIINEEEILQNAKEIEITFNDGTVVKQMISGKGTIVLHHNEENKEPISYTKLVIYDKDMKVLYER